MVARNLTALLLVLLMMLTGCTDDPTEPSPDAARSAATLADDELGPEIVQNTPVQELPFARISQRIPAFAGFYVEGEEVVARSTDPSVAEAIRAEVADFFETRRTSAPSNIRTVPADYTYGELADWRDRLIRVHPKTRKVLQ